MIREIFYSTIIAAVLASCVDNPYNPVWTGEVTSAEGLITQLYVSTGDVVQQYSAHIVTTPGVNRPRNRRGSISVTRDLAGTVTTDCQRHVLARALEPICNNTKLSKILDEALAAHHKQRRK